ncbi:sodium-dependent glucose transporter 1-like [Mya arenaria]|uniref:sodium-dependent glucose transporter 1-like n=1 Tax=Mya arenaria TaxID=6604 RepID=UPI0022E6D71F|nr:sodium-dependent glucose transporter 1-like [Mya arenaria]
MSTTASSNEGFEAASELTGDERVARITEEVDSPEKGAEDGPLCTEEGAWVNGVELEMGSGEGEDTGPLPMDLVLKELAVNDDRGPGKKDVGFAAVPGDKEEAEMQESCANPVFRRKVLDTIFLFWNVTNMGWIYGQMGPALPDLQIVAGVSLAQATWLFTGFALGYLGGCLLAGFIQDKFNPRLMLFLFTTGTAITIGLLPWIPEIIAMVIIRVINGICIGGQDTGIHTMLFATWAKEGGPFVQMTHCLSAVGGILSPLVTQPFVSKQKVEEELDGVDVSVNTTTMAAPTPYTSGMNMTKNTTYTTTVEVNIQYAFLITFVLSLSSAVPFLVAYLSNRNEKKVVRQYSNASVDRHKLPKRVKKVILCIIFVNSFVATANIDLFPSFLVTFTLEQLGWTQQEASTLTSVYFGTYGLANFAGVFLLTYITSTKLKAFSYISSTIVLLGLLLSVIFKQNILVWVTIAASGVTMSSILPTLFTWTQEHVTPITSRMASGLLISGSVGVMVNPLVLGYMMDIYSPMWFLYLSLGEIVVCGLLFTAAFTLSRVYSQSDDQRAHMTGMTKGDNVSSETVEAPTGTPEPTEKLEIYPRGTFYGV